MNVVVVFGLKLLLEWLKITMQDSSLTVRRISPEPKQNFKEPLLNYVRLRRPTSVEITTINYAVQVTVNARELTLTTK